MARTAGSKPRKAPCDPFEQVEWSRVEMEAWLIQQAYEGVLRDVEAGNGNATRSGLLCKEAVAEMAESVLLRISKVVGGGAYSQQFAVWFLASGCASFGVPHDRLGDSPSIASLTAANRMDRMSTMRPLVLSWRKCHRRR